MTTVEMREILTDDAPVRNSRKPLSPEMGAILLENCRRFAAGHLNVVNKVKWY